MRVLSPSQQSVCQTRWRIRLVSNEPLRFFFIPPVVFGLAVVLVDEKEVGWGGVAGRVRGHPNSKGAIKRQEVKWNPHTERR